MITIKDLNFEKIETGDTTSYLVKVLLIESVNGQTFDCAEADLDCARTLTTSLFKRIYGQALDELRELQTRLQYRTDIVHEPAFHSRFVRLQMMLEGKEVIPYA